MNRQLRTLASNHSFETDQYQKQRLAFGISCVNRITHLLIDEQLTTILNDAQLFLADKLSQAEFDIQVNEAKKIAQSHAGSNGMDGAGSAAVSATFAVARALAGDAINAAEYAAYASVYAYASHTVSDPSAYEKEYQWQVQALEKILQKNNIPRIKES